MRSTVPCSSGMLSALILSLQACIFSSQSLGVDGSRGNRTTIVLGYLTPMTGSYTGGILTSAAVPIAIDKVNTEYLIEGYWLEYSWRDSSCNAGKGLSAMSDFLEEGAAVFIGPSCSIACEPSQLLASARKVVQVGRCS